jgi:hypothetical protein
MRRANSAIRAPAARSKADFIGQRRRCVNQLFDYPE